MLQSQPTSHLSLWLLIWVSALLLLNCQTPSTDTLTKPNIIFVMADDLGYGDLGCYGQQVIKTPNLDALAHKGTRFTHFYSGSPVCAPARSVLMTGRHTGHTTVRGNFGQGGVRGLGGGEGRVPLRAEDTTLAEVLRSAGYVTAMTGKWGLGEPGTTGLPNDQGFDQWFGHLNQRRAHNHFTDYLWKDTIRYPIAANANGAEIVYSHDLFTAFALDFIARQAESPAPFFLYLPWLLPHDAYQIPETHPDYIDQDWPKDAKVHASMIRRIDRDIGRLVHLLDSLQIRDQTLFCFTSDNGAAQRWDGIFDSSGALRGRKRDVYEGGIRAPMIMSLPGTIPADRVDPTPWYMADILPTFSDLAGIEKLPVVDGHSLWPYFTGQDKSPFNERLLYWEFHEQGGKQAVRQGHWKAVRLDVQEKGFHPNIELYNLQADPAETQNIADEHPDIVEHMLMLMEREHTISAAFPFNFEK